MIQDNFHEENIQKYLIKETNKPARKMISFLGTSPYVSCNYYFKDKTINNCRFIQAALGEIFCSSWQEEDSIIIFTTKDAYEKNWIDGKEAGLASTLETLNLNCNYKNVMIPEGSVDELWIIFDKIFEEFGEKDEVIFDITHAFRSLPMLAIIILNYSKFLKNIKLKGIYYGAFEKLGNPREVQNIPIEKRNAPVFDLTSFVTLMDWTIEAERFLRDGDTEGIGSLSEEVAREILRETKGKNIQARALRDFSSSLKTFSGNISTCRGSSLPTSIKKLLENMENAEQATEELVKPMGKLMGKMRNKLQGFKSDDDVTVIHEAVKWCCNHGLIQQGLTLLQENIITYVAKKNGLALDDLSIRIYIARILNSAARKIELESGEVKEIPEGICPEEILRSLAPSIPGLFESLSQYRNDINHAGFRDNSHMAGDFLKKLSEGIEEFERVLMS